jgi:hypothetical protein
VIKNCKLQIKNDISAGPLQGKFALWANQTKNTLKIHHIYHKYKDLARILSQIVILDKF